MQKKKKLAAADTPKKDRVDLFIEDYSEKLIIDEHALDLELLQQAHTFNEIAQAAVDQEARRDKYKETMAQVDAELSHDIRSKKSDTRITDAYVLAQVLNHPDHKDISDKFLLAKHRAARLAALKEAYINRGWMVRELVQLHAIGYFTESAISPKRGAAGEARSEGVRKTMAQNRRDRDRD